MNQEPYPSVECSNCGTRDGDVFPGQVRDYYGEHED